MKELNDISVVYFIGIGGIGMSALARFFHERGITVSGYDKTPTQLTKELEKEGIQVHYQDDLSHVSKTADLVVYTPAIPSTHTGLNFYREHGYTILKRSEVLGMITRSLKTICVAGTHGKTTISTMVAHLLRASGFGCNAFLGGISVNYQTNFWSSKNNVCVVEADEYDRSFHQLQPEIAIISSMDPDHLDIYHTATAMEEAFITFSEKIRPGGWLIRKKGLSRGDELKATHSITYHLTDEQALVYARNLKPSGGGYRFDVVLKHVPQQPEIINEVVLNAGGLHNVENALAAVSAARLIGVEPGKIAEALASYRGVRRRFEYILKPGEGSVVMIDDYAHHPAELNALIEGVKHLFPDHHLLLAFQPHLYSRTRDLAGDFAQSLDRADEVILLPVYPARELPIDGVSSALLLNKMYLKDKQIVEKENLSTAIQTSVHQLRKTGKDVVLVTAGAGDIDTLIPQIKEQIIHVEA